MSEYIINTESDSCIYLSMLKGEVEVAKIITAAILPKKAERLIRCRDCKHCTAQVFYREVQGHICYLTEQSITLDDYCSRAEEEER